MTETSQPFKVNVVFNDPPVHCIDLRNAFGERQLRIRPKDGGITIEGAEVAIYLNREELAEFSSALSRIEAR